MRDADHMRRALELAASAEGRVSPRPPVGAVVLDRSGELVGEGATQSAPGPHAEVAALAEAGERARDGTIYVTLEPCSFPGTSVRRPACADAIVEAGIGRVVAAIRDPYPRVNGRGFRRLRQAGIEVRTGVQRPTARRLIEPFAHRTRTGRPFVTLKLAATLDGKVAAPDGTSRWITGPQARDEVHDLRRRVDAVAVGAGTVCADDPQLTCRLPGYSGRQPVRVVIDSSGRTPPDARVFDGSAPAVIVSTPQVDAARWNGIEVLSVPAADGHVDLGAALAALSDRGLCHLLVEGGPTLAGALVEGGLVDRLLLYLAPKLVGGDAPGMLADGVKTISDAWNLEIVASGRAGDDFRIEARFAGERDN